MTRTKDLKIAAEDAQDASRELSSVMAGIVAEKTIEYKRMAAEAVERKEKEYELNSKKEH